MKELVDQANDLINDLETKYLFDLIVAYHESIPRAEKCGCPSCKKRPDTLQGMIDDERDRLKPGEIIVYKSGGL